MLHPSGGHVEKDRVAADAVPVEERAQDFVQRSQAGPLRRSGESALSGRTYMYSKYERVPPVARRLNRASKTCSTKAGEKLLKGSPETM